MYQIKVKISNSYLQSPRVFTVINLFIILCASCSVNVAYSDDALTAQEQLGRKIYREGSDGSQTEITATLGLTDDSVSATAFACANCHGLEGEGKQEGGLTIPAITSQQLFSGSSSNKGAKKNYDDSTLVRAITKGINNQDKALSPTMPRYNFSADQEQTLLAYLKHLGSISDVESGITDIEVQLATILPLTGPLAATGNLLKATLEACIAEVNKQGLIYGRKVTLATLDSADSINETLSATKRLSSEVKLFALVSGYFPEFTSELYTALSQEKIPVIAPLTFEPYDSPTPSATFFYFLPSFADQSKALIDFWLAHVEEYKSSAKSKLAIIHNGKTVDLRLVEVIRRQLQQHHIDLMVDIAMMPNANTLLAKLISKKPDAIFFMGNADELATLDKMLPNMVRPPLLLGLLAMLSADVVNMHDLTMSQMLLASPFNLNVGMPQFTTMLDRYSIRIESPGLQRTACAAVNFVAEGLKRTGKHVTRSKFIDSLAEVQNFSMDIMPPLQFDPNNRIGARGAYILSVNTKMGAISSPSDWVTATDKRSD